MAKAQYKNKEDLQKAKDKLVSCNFRKIKNGQILVNLKKIKI